MLTFEEFFVKKRIDLLQLQRAQPELYEEFKTHYPLMGEKSFDHTKKYWFNRLRKDFQLSEDKTAQMAPKTANKPAGVTPRFKAKLAIQKENAGIQDIPAASAPRGFKPRFKPEVTTPQKETPQSKVPTAESAQPTKPLGFKPRFKAGGTPTAKPTEAPKGEPKDSPNPDTETPSPAMPTKPLGFKPRFKTNSNPTQSTPPNDEKSGDS